MKLLSIDVRGFKRFAEKQRVILDGKLVAIVGSNESGKTSLLDALEHLNHEDEFRSDGPSQETSRGQHYKSGTTIVKATFQLDETDRETLRDIPGGRSIRIYQIGKKLGLPGLHVSFSPTPKRDIAKRNTILDRVDSLQSRLLEAASKFETEQKKLKTFNIGFFLDIRERRDFSEITVKGIRDFADAVDTLTSTYSIPEAQGLSNDLRSLADEESKTHPEDEARRILDRQRPRFILFTDEDRRLRSDYNLQAHFRTDAAREEVPRALANLARACGLDLEQLHTARAKIDEGKVGTLLARANERLKQLLSSWSQTGISVHLTYNRSQLNVLVSSDEGEFVRLAERSDGLRQFIALIAFLSQKITDLVPLILLVDEAETHLHYDAQADLIQMLARQDVATSVIYTTHSIGCLPEDLGNVRLVETSGQYSNVRNWFWDSSTPGFSPLLFGMGARTLAFIPVRFALIAEGACDFLLLPAMFKESIDEGFLGFQVVPGLARSSTDQIGVINNESPRTAYITDNDDAGKKIRRRIRQAGVHASRIFSLPELQGGPAVVEDFIDTNSYIHAVNEVIAAANDGAKFINAEEVGTNCRPLAVESWCGLNGYTLPSKRAIAYRLLENRHQYRLTSEVHRDALLHLYKQIQSSLGIIR